MKQVTTIDYYYEGKREKKSRSTVYNSYLLQKYLSLENCAYMTYLHK